MTATHAPPVAAPPRAPGGDRAVREALAAALAGGDAWALCVVAATEGSTYRKPGGLVLARPGRAAVGTLSGGCLEQDLAERCEHAIGRARPALQVFDTLGDDDLVFGSGSGCRGRMHVLVLPSSDEGSVAAARLLCGAGRSIVEFSLATDAAGGVSGHCSCGDRQVALGEAGRGTAKDGSAMALRFRVPPPPRVLLLGAGPEAAPLAAACLAMGWRVELLDHRPARLAALRGQVDATHEGRPAAALAAAAPRPTDALVLMSHSASIDAEALAVAGDLEVGYVGLLGPPLRRDELLAPLPAVARARLAPRLHAPVGLRLGGHGPEALALSIAAGLQQYFCATPPAAPG